MDLFGNSVSGTEEGDIPAGGEREKRHGRHGNEQSGKTLDVAQAEIFFRPEDDEKVIFRDERDRSHDVDKHTVKSSGADFSEEDVGSGCVADTDVVTDSAGGIQSNEHSVAGSIIVRQPKTASDMMDRMKFMLLNRKFEHGSLVQAITKDGRPFMLLFQLGADLMAFRYLGTSLDVEIPASVGKRPVKYIHPQLLVGGMGPFSGVKAQSLKDNFSYENLAGLSKDSLLTSLKGVKSLLLPEGLTMLPPKVFYHCTALRELVVPSTVTAISYDTFYGSCFKDIYFNGRCPQGFHHNAGLPKGVQIHYRKEFEGSFVGVK